MRVVIWSLLLCLASAGKHEATDEASTEEADLWTSDEDTLLRDGATHAPSHTLSSELEDDHDDLDLDSEEEAWRDDDKKAKDEAEDQFVTEYNNDQYADEYEGEDQGDEGEDQGDKGEDQGDKGEDQGDKDKGEDQGDEGEDQGDEGEDQGDEGEDQGDKGEDQGDKGEDQGDEGEDQGDKGEDQGDEGEDQGDEDRIKRKVIFGGGGGYSSVNRGIGGGAGGDPYGRRRDNHNYHGPDYGNYGSWSYGRGEYVDTSSFDDEQIDPPEPSPAKTTTTTPKPTPRVPTRSRAYGIVRSSPGDTDVPSSSGRKSKTGRRETKRKLPKDLKWEIAEYALQHGTRQAVQFYSQKLGKRIGEKKIEKFVRRYQQRKERTEARQN